MNRFMNWYLMPGEQPTHHTPREFGGDLPGLGRFNVQIPHYSQVWSAGTPARLAIPAAVSLAAAAESDTHPGCD